MTKMLEELKSYRAGVTLLEDLEGRRWSFCENDWNGEFWNATEENEDGEIIKGSFAEICELVVWDGATDTGDRVGYVFGGQNIMVRPEICLDQLDYHWQNRNIGWCRPYKLTDNTFFTVQEGEIFDAKGQKITDNQLKVLAQKYNTDYDCYSGWDNLHILLEAAEEVSCHDCPCKDFCEAVQEKTGRYIDDDGEVYEE